MDYRLGLPEEIQRDMQGLKDSGSFFIAYQNGKIVYFGYETTHLKDGRDIKINLDFVVEKLFGLTCNDPIQIFKSG